jgi:hypothetical protein
VLTFTETELRLEDDSFLGCAPFGLVEIDPTFQRCVCLHHRPDDEGNMHPGNDVLLQRDYAALIFILAAVRT